MKAILFKIKERSNLKHKFIANIDCLNPITINKRSINPLLKKLSGCLTKVRKINLLTQEQCYQIEAQYKKFVSEAKGEHKEKFAKFSLEEERLDEFYKNTMHIEMKSRPLWKFMKIAFTIFHGQAIVEGGFSTNADTLKTNMGEKMIITRRCIYNAVEVSFQNEIFRCSINTFLLFEIK